MCQVLCPPGSHSGDASRSRTIVELATGLAWDGVLTTFLFPPRSSGSSAHWTPAHPQRLLHHQRPRQKRYAVWHGRPRTRGAQGGEGVSATVVTCELASAGQLSEHPLGASAQRLYVGCSMSIRAGLHQKQCVVSGEEGGLNAGLLRDSVESPVSFPAATLPRTPGWAPLTAPSLLLSCPRSRPASRAQDGKCAGTVVLQRSQQREPLRARTQCTRCLLLQPIRRRRSWAASRTGSTSCPSC